VTYLFGMWIRQAGRERRFEYILAERPEDEEAACRQFWNFVGSQGECVYYVHSAREPPRAKLSVKSGPRYLMAM